MQKNPTDLQMETLKEKALLIGSFIAAMIVALCLGVRGDDVVLAGLGGFFVSMSLLFFKWKKANFQHLSGEKS